MKYTFDMVQDLRVLRGINEAEFKTLLQTVGAFTKKTKKGAYITLADEEVRCVRVILKGTVHMMSEDIWGNRSILVFMNRGDLFGESFACSSHQVSLVNFYAASDVTGLYIPFDKLLSLSANDSGAYRQLVQNIMTLIADKNVRILQKLEIVSKRNLRDKLMAYFSYMAKAWGSMEFDVPLGRVALSEYLCVDRSALTRELSRMQDDGLIEFEKNHFKILAPVDSLA